MDIEIKHLKTGFGVNKVIDVITGRIDFYFSVAIRNIQANIVAWCSITHFHFSILYNSFLAVQWFINHHTSYPKPGKFNFRNFINLSSLIAKCS